MQLIHEDISIVESSAFNILRELSAASPERPCLQYFLYNNLTAGSLYIITGISIHWNVYNVLC